MPRIRWGTDHEDEFGYDLVGYLGKAEIGTIIYDRRDEEYYLSVIRKSNGLYRSLSSAKRGAERMLDKFLNDANLTIKENHDEK